VFDVAVTGDISYAETYLTVGEVLLNGPDALGDEGPVVLAAPVSVDATPPSGAETVSTIVAEPAQPPMSIAEPRTGEPTVILQGDLVAAYSDSALDDDVVTEMSAGIRAEAGTVLVLRTEHCPAGEAVVFTDVINLDTGESALSLLCDPRMLVGGTADEDDELVEGETYVWIPAAGTYGVVIDTDALVPTPMTVELYTDPTPTVVAQADVTTDGHAATLSGIGDTVVYALDGSAPETVELAATGLDVACVVEAWGADPLGSTAPWSLGYCAHAASAGSGITASGFPVPVVVFARTDEDIDIRVTPHS
jgi:hypothetical protein